MTDKTPAATATGLRRNEDIPMTNREILERTRAHPVRGEYPEEVKAALSQRKNQHLIAAKMSEMNWGKGLDEMTRRAVAAYLDRNRLDLTEVDVLGGNLYRNSRYFKRRLAEMVEDGNVEYVKSDWVQVDKRLDLHNDEWSTNEKTRRERIRIEYGIPEAAVGACVFRIKVKGVSIEFTAAKWCGGGTRQKDPVGDAFPIETSESRACRRAMTLCASSIPALRWREEELDDDGVELSSVIKEARAAGDTQEVFATQPKALGKPADGEYGAPVLDRIHEIEPTEDQLAFDAEIAARDER